MSLTIRSHSQLLGNSCLILPVFAFLSGCGLSDKVNSQISAEDTNLQTQACKQMLQHVDLIVSGVMAQAAAEPGTTPPAICQKIQMTQCTVCYTSTPQEQTLELQTLGCAIDTPPEGKDYSLEMTLKDLSMSALQQPPSQIKIDGHGHITLGAVLPLLGALHATTGYEVRSGIIDTSKGTLDLDLHMTYQGDSGPLIEVEVTVSGSRENINGAVLGQNLSCTVTGSLISPNISCR